MQDPIGDRPIGEQGGVAAPAGRHQLRLTGDVQKGFLLAGKAGLRQVFSGGTGAHRHRDSLGLPPSSVGLPQAPIGPEDGQLEVLRQPGRQHQGPGGPTGRLQGSKIVAIETSQQAPQGLPKLVGVQEGPVGIGRGGKAPRHPYPFGSQLPQQFAQGGVLAPHGRDRLQPSRLQGQD